MVQSMKFLISTSRSVLLFDLLAQRFEVIHSGRGLYYGISRFPGGYLVAARNRMVSSGDPIESERGEILVLDHAFRHIDSWSAPFPLIDIHQIRWHNEQLWVICTFHDMIAIRSASGSWRKWFPLGVHPEEQKDQHHFNSLTFSAESLYLLAHNHGPSRVFKFESANPSGPIGEFSIGIQSHNLWLHANEWHTCSSFEGGVVSESGVRVIETGGFPRGVSPIYNLGWLLGVSEILERQDRDFSGAKLLVLDQKWRVQLEIEIADQGLLLDILPSV